MPSTCNAKGLKHSTLVELFPMGQVIKTINIMYRSSGANGKIRHVGQDIMKKGIY